jgi:hypothetical protein
MATATRIGRIALILALLPGLLLAEGERLRICLHALVGQAEACHAMAEAPSSCCAAPDSGEPVLKDATPCEGCCVELAPQGTEHVAPAPRSGVESNLLPALPAEIGIAVLAPVAAPAPAARVWRAPTSPPGRAPTPLRI